MAVPDTPLSEVFSYHLRYELEMLSQTHILIGAIQDQKPNAQLVNALIESFCIHARNIFEFFSKKSSRGKNNNVARDFADANFVPLTSKQHSTLENLISNKINNQITHLIHKKRTKLAPEQIGHIERDEIISIVADVVQNFKKHLKPEYLASDLPDIKPLMLTVTGTQTTTTAISSVISVIGLKGTIS